MANDVKLPPERSPEFLAWWHDKGRKLCIEPGCAEHAFEAGRAAPRVLGAGLDPWPDSGDPAIADALRAPDSGEAVLAPAPPVIFQRYQRVDAKAALHALAKYFHRVSDLWEGPDGCSTDETILCNDIERLLDMLAHTPMALGLTKIPPFPEMKP